MTVLWVLRDALGLTGTKYGCGQIMSAVALLSRNRNPTDADIDGAMSVNLCRCATYVRTRAAIHEAARSLA